MWITYKKEIKIYFIKSEFVILQLMGVGLIGQHGLSVTSYVVQENNHV